MYFTYKLLRNNNLAHIRTTGIVFNKYQYFLKKYYCQPKLVAFQKSTKKGCLIAFFYYLLVVEIYRRSEQEQGISLPYQDRD